MTLEHKFRRVTSGRSFIPEIDGLRFIAIASVVAFHMYGELLRYYGLRVGRLAGTVLGHGGRGVSLFFVISGFILALPFASRWLHGGRRVDMKAYFLRRLTRLEPPYFLNLILCFVLAIVLNSASAHSQLPHLLASMSYTHNLIFGTMSNINAVAWSLEVEVQFYCLVPLLSLVFAVRSTVLRRASVLILMGACAFAQVMWFDSSRMQLSIGYYLQFFLAGFVLADLYLAGLGPKHWLWDIVSLVGWPAVFLANDLFVRVGIPFLAIALYVAAFRGPLANRIFRHPLLTVVGGMCYTVYLFHSQVVAAVVRVLGHKQSPLVVVAVAVPVIVAASGVYYLLIERPCMDKNWPSKLGAALIAALGPRYQRIRLGKSISVNQGV